jgi:subtilisin-like proprotein convertase family protein
VVAEESGIDTRGAFSRDISLAWGLEDFVEGEPAEIDFKGVNSLKKAKTSMITGYPAELDYTGESGGYFLHATEPDLTPFRQALTTGSSYLYATHISTGPGNSGGPVWGQDESGQWKVSGLLVSGRPSEAGVYAMSSSVKSLLRAAAPAIADPRKSTKAVATVSTDTCRMVMNKPKKIPDGLHRWTKIPLKCIRFPEGSVVAAAYLDLTITTGHRGDLIVAVLGPDGTAVTVHNGQGAGEDDLVFDDLSIGPFFTAAEASAVGNWALLVQDRLTADPAVVTRLELEIVAKPKTTSGGEETP